MQRPQILWNPQEGPQKALIDCPLPEIFFGGSRGGGKTDGVLGKYALKALRYGAAFNALFCRRELPMLDDAIERSKNIFGPIGRYREQTKTWRFHAGGRLRFRPLERLSDADKYQGQNISDACIEEAGQYPDPRPIDRLRAVLRSASGVPTQLILTGNPGGAGQGWIKSRYIDPAPKGFTVFARSIDLPEWAGGGAETVKWVFIPSKLGNNRYLGRDYVASLHLVGSEALVKAWLDGDWSAIEGAFFDCFETEKHVVAGFKIPDFWTRFRAMDWGFAAPFSVGWYAVASDPTKLSNGLTLPRGGLIKYREWYGANEKGVGIRLQAEQIAEGIRGRTPKDERIDYGVLDPAAFSKVGEAHGNPGPSIAERMTARKVIFRAADNNRLNGWDQMRSRLIGDDDGNPMLVFAQSCLASIRTIPMLQHDQLKPEDLDTEAEDHAADETRYGCMSRPWAKPASKKLSPHRYRKHTKPATGSAWAV